MPIPFSCPHCGVFTEVEERFAGTSGPCASCGKTITVPHAASGSAAGTAAVAGAAGISIVAILLIVFVVLIVFVGIIGILIALLLPAVSAAREAARRVQCANNLRQIGIALQMYENQYGTYPPAYIADENGKPMHSWRVLILPQLGQQALYDQYDFSKPWDSLENQAVAWQMPLVYACASGDSNRMQETSYMVISGPGMMFEGDKPLNRAHIRDGPSNTIMVIEAADSSVHWMEPVDLDGSRITFQINSDNPGQINSDHHGGVNVLLADGAVLFLDEDTPAEEIEAMATRAGNERVMPRDWQQ